MSTCSAGGCSRDEDDRRSPRAAPARGAPAGMSAPLPAGVRQDVALDRLTTIRTGGAGEFFARAGSAPDLVELLAWAAQLELEVSVIGSGSNLLVADDGVCGLVVKLDRDLAAIAVRSRSRDRKSTRLNSS